MLSQPLKIELRGYFYHFIEEEIIYKSFENGIIYTRHETFNLVEVGRAKINKCTIINNKIKLQFGTSRYLQKGTISGFIYEDGKILGKGFYKDKDDPAIINSNVFANNEGYIIK